MLSKLFFLKNFKKKRSVASQDKLFIGTPFVLKEPLSSFERINALPLKSVLDAPGYILLILFFFVKLNLPVLPSRSSCEKTFLFFSKKTLNFLFEVNNESKLLLSLVKFKLFKTVWFCILIFTSPPSTPLFKFFLKRFLTSLMFTWLSKELLELDKIFLYLKESKDSVLTSLIKLFLLILDINGVAA